LAKTPSKTGASRTSGKLTELRQRLLFVLGAVLVFRIGAHIPVPGISSAALAQLVDSQSGTVLDMFNMFSGGALSRLSVFALGVMPYISASIIMQLLSNVHPKLEQLKKEGAAGRRKISQMTRYGTVVLSTFQATGIAIALESQGASGFPVVLDPGLAFRLVTVVTLVTGTLFLMWLGEQVTERGIGNGVSLIIFASIVSGLPAAFGGTLELSRITINYAQRQRGRKMYAGQTSHLPLKLNMAGVIPPIFASSIILFPSTLGSWFSGMEGMGWLRNFSDALSPGQPAYVVCYALAIVFFCYFYTALQFNPRDTADNLKRSGAFVPGVRPGEQTARYIDSIMGRLTLGGAIYITAVCLLPEFLILYWNVPFYFGGTSLLIVVVVIMDFITQVQTHMLSHQYEGLMKKANAKGGGAGGLFT